MAKTVFLFFGVCFFIHEAGGQNQKTIDSLNAVLQTKTGGERYPPFYELAFEYLDVDNEKALEFIQQAEAAALLSGDSLWIVKSMRVKGQILSKLERTAEAIPIFESALAISSRNNFEQESMWITNSFGSVCLFRGQFDKALENFVKTLEFSQRENDSAQTVSSLNNIGMTYYKLHDHRKALVYLFKALELKKRHMKVPIDLDINSNISLCYSNLDEFSTAEFYLKKSLQECSGGCPKEKKMHIELAAGFISHGFKQYDQALVHFSNSLSLAKEVHSSRLILDNVVWISDILIRRNDIKKAEFFLQQGEKLIRKGVPFPTTILDVYSRFSQLYLKMNDYEALSFYQGKYIHLKDSIYNYELTTRLMAAEAGFRERENKTKIEAQNEIILLKEQVINRQEALNVGTGLLGFITLIFAVVLFRNFRRKKDLNVLLEQKIRERTVELESSRDELLRMIKEKDMKIGRASGLIVDSVNTIEGLCLTAGKEVSDPVAHSYLRRIIKISGCIPASLEVVFQDLLYLPSA